MSVIKCDFKDLSKVLQKEVQNEIKQIKFAAMNALNDVAFKDCRANLVKAYEHTFRVRNKSFPRAIQIKKATKDNLQVEVSYKADFMAIHAKGGTREPDDGKKMLTIPYENDVTVKHAPNGKVRQRDRVPSLLRDYDSKNFKKSVGHSAVKHAFLLKYGDGRAVVMKRAKNTTTLASRERGNGDKVFYALKNKAKIEKKWDFEKIVTTTADRHLKKYFDKRLDEALKTAK